MDTIEKVINPINGNSVLFLIEETKKVIYETAEEKPELKDVADKIIIPMLNTLNATVRQFATVQAYEGSKNYGYWLPGSGLKIKCSSCNKETYGGKSPYCPNCGIEMKEKTDVLAKLQ